ncbi:MAG: ribose-5-phosphate isomerase RpiA [Ferruginibacter sp.]
MENHKEAEKELAAKEAVKLIRDGAVVGLGTGSTAYYAIKEIALLVKQGMHIQGIPTSEKTKSLALSLNIPLIDINTVSVIDITIDGADEFTEQLYLIKGGGGALVREKIIASMTKQEIIIADTSKKVDQLGKFTVPIAIVPFAQQYVLQQLEKINGKGLLRKKNEIVFITDDGNHIIDADFGLIKDPVALADSFNTIEGIVAHGLFVSLAQRVIMGTGNGTQIFYNTNFEH